jgi:hypothetical protein
MTGAYLLLCLPLYQNSVDKPSLNLFQDSFIVRVGDKRAEVPLQLPKEKPLLSLSYRKNKNYAVWDDRGLTIRIGNKAKSTRLEDIALSPKAFEREQILENIDLIKKKQRTAGATALSGSKRVGTMAFFLVRWEDKAGKPWMEALVSVDLAEPTYHPQFLARVTGLSLAEKKIDDQLFILGNQMSCVVRKGEQWGVAAFDPDASQFKFKEIGRRLESYQALPNLQGVFVEKSDYGSRVGGRVNLLDLTRKSLVETKGSLRFADKTDPLIALMTKGNDTRLLNTETGAELDLLSSVAMRRTSLGLVVWSPFKAPKRAWLYSMDRWSPLAEWTAAP